MTKLPTDFLKETTMLDFNHPQIKTLIEQRKWRDLSPYDAIGAICAFGSAWKKLSELLGVESWRIQWCCEALQIV